MFWMTPLLQPTISMAEPAHAVIVVSLIVKFVRPDSLIASWLPLGPMCEILRFLSWMPVMYGSLAEWLSMLMPLPL